MNKKQKRRAIKWGIIGISPFILVPLLVAALLVLRWVNQPDPVSLPNGSTVALEGVTFGKKHLMPDAISHIITDNLPYSVTGFLGIKPPPSLQTDRLNLAVWLKRSHPKSTSKNRQPPDPLTVRLVDKHGFEAPISGSRHTWRRSKSAYHVRSTENFPRQSDNIRLRLYWTKGPKDRLLQEVNVDNPYAVASSPSWKADPLPITQFTNRLEVTLMSAKIGIDSASKPKIPAGQVNRPASRLHLRIKENNSLVDYWIPRQIEISTPGGNMAIVRGSSRLVAEGTRQFVFGWPLWSDESVCELRIEFVKGKKAPFSSDEITSITTPLTKPTTNNVPPKPLKMAQFVNKKIPIQVPILQNFFDVHFTLFWTNDQGFQLRMPRLFDAYDFNVTLLRVTNANGRSIPTKDFRWQYRTGRSVLDLPPVENLNRLNFRVAIHKSRWLTFRIKPKFLTASTKKSSNVSK